MLPLDNLQYLTQNQDIGKLDGMKRARSSPPSLLSGASTGREELQWVLTSCGDEFYQRTDQALTVISVMFKWVDNIIIFKSSKRELFNELKRSSKDTKNTKLP